MKVLRTPEERFKNLPGYPYEPNYIEDLQGYENLRMHYVDEGSKESDIVFSLVIIYISPKIRLGILPSIKKKKKRDAAISAF